MAHASLTEIDLRIRTLSSLITNLNKQIESPEFTHHPRNSSTLVACSHIATLLTRGVDDASNRLVGPGRKVVAVSGRIASHVSLAVSVDANEVDEDPAVSLSNAKDRPKFRIDRIQPSSTCLQDLAAPPYHVNEDILQVYAANLLAAVRDLEDTLDIYPFMTFVVRSCLPKITHRLGADLHVFKRPLDKILNGWSPGPHDVLASKRVRVLPEYQIIRTHLVDASVTGEGDQFEWSIDTAPMWIAALCHVIREAKRCARNCRNPDRTNKVLNTYALQALTSVLAALHLLSYRAPIRELLALPSIERRLNEDRWDDIQDSLITDDDGLDMTPEADEDSRSMARRYLCNAVAWHSAMYYILRSVKNSRSFKNITLDFVVTPVTSPDACAPEELLVNAAIAYMLNKVAWDPQSKKAQSLIQEFKKKILPLKFCGTVHCEASLMGLVVACKDNTIPLPNDIKREELEVFKNLVTSNGVTTIGVGKKCCWCCSWLANQLHVAHPHISFQVPASHGLIFQWALPTIGISAKVAEDMETALKEIWRREVGKFAEDFERCSRNATQSAMSPPSSSISTSIDDMVADALGQRSKPIYGR